MWQSVFNLGDNSVFFRSPNHHMAEFSDGEQTPISAVCDRPSVKGPDLIARGQALRNVMNPGCKGPPFF